MTSCLYVALQVFFNSCVLDIWVELGCFFVIAQLEICQAPFIEQVYVVDNCYLQPYWLACQQEYIPSYIFTAIHIQKTLRKLQTNVHGEMAYACG